MIENFTYKAHKHTILAIMLWLLIYESREEKFRGCKPFRDRYQTAVQKIKIFRSVTIYFSSQEFEEIENKITLLRYPSEVCKNDARKFPDRILVKVENRCHSMRITTASHGTLISLSPCTYLEGLSIFVRKPGPYTLTDPILLQYDPQMHGNVLFHECDHRNNHSGVGNLNYPMGAFSIISPRTWQTKCLKPTIDNSQDKDRFTLTISRRSEFDRKL